MRRHAEIAQHTVEGAHNALLAARRAAQDTIDIAQGLTIEAADAMAIRGAALVHLRRVDSAIQAIEQALRSAAEVNAAVDRAEITRFGLPVLAARTGA